jgi:hypothetical protein
MKKFMDKGTLTYDFTPAFKRKSPYNVFTIQELMENSLGALKEKFGISNLSLSESFQLRRIVEQAADHVLQQTKISGLPMHRDITVHLAAAYEFVTQNYGIHLQDAYFFMANTQGLREPFKVWIELQRDQSHGLGLDKTPKLDSWWAKKLAEHRKSEAMSYN